MLRSGDHEVTDRLIEELEAEARYHRERLALYRAKTYGAQPTSADRLHKLERASDYADQRLRRARAVRRGPAGRAPGAVGEVAMSKQLGGNEDWIKREMGRIPTKGAMAAERASAGLGTSGDDPGLSGEFRPRLTAWTKPAQRNPSRSDKDIGS
jgi:hypothetical protein